MSKQRIKISKYLSYILRHRPDSIGLELDGQGWADVEELITCSNAQGKNLTRELIAEVVATNDKQRFCLSADGGKIRANQGHTFPVDLGLKPVRPPAVLYHGTAEHFVAGIMQQGLQALGRQHVHLSTDRETAMQVGARHGRPVVLQVDAGRLHREGHLFYLSANGVWLTESVPAGYLTINRQQITFNG
jgi:putative RNA 2'-phosphotransferase